jgi:hypothetical protein
MAKGIKELLAFLPSILMQSDTRANLIFFISTIVNFNDNVFGPGCQTPK